MGVLYVAHEFIPGIYWGYCFLFFLCVFMCICVEWFVLHPLRFCFTGFILSKDIPSFVISVLLLHFTNGWKLLSLYECYYSCLIPLVNNEDLIGLFVSIWKKSGTHVLKGKSRHKKLYGRFQSRKYQLIMFNCHIKVINHICNFKLFISFSQMFYHNNIINKNDKKRKAWCNQCHW